MSNQGIKVVKRNRNVTPRVRLTAEEIKERQKILFIRHIDNAARVDLDLLEFLIQDLYTQLLV